MRDAHSFDNGRWQRLRHCEPPIDVLRSRECRIEWGTKFAANRHLADLRALLCPPPK
jgi:hypothetical protein